MAFLWTLFRWLVSHDFMFYQIFGLLCIYLIYSLFFVGVGVGIAVAGFSSFFCFWYVSTFFKLCALMKAIKFDFTHDKYELHCNACISFFTFIHICLWQNHSIIQNSTLNKFHRLVFIVLWELILLFESHSFLEWKMPRNIIILSLLLPVYCNFVYIQTTFCYFKRSALTGNGIGIKKKWNQNDFLTK